jgi:hypothetical protein
MLVELPNTTVPEFSQADDGATLIGSRLLAWLQLAQKDK